MNLDTLSVRDLQQGWATDPETGVMRCLHCPECFEPGEVYPQPDGRLFLAERAVERHVRREHPDHLQRLIHSDSKYNTLTDNQRRLLELFAAGLPDKEIARRLELSPSTVRHQKFIFREKAKQARLYLAFSELALQPGAKEDDIVPIHDHATMVDQRYVATQEERDHILKTFFSSLEPLRLREFSPKEKKKVVILARIAQEFQPGKRYTEGEVSGLLKEIYPDFATLRRYLIEYAFLKRTRDGSAYWLP